MSKDNPLDMPLLLATGTSATNLIAIALGIWALIVAYQTGTFTGMVISAIYFLLFGLVMPGLISHLPRVLRAVFFPFVPLLLYWAIRVWGGTFSIVILSFIAIGLFIQLAYKWQDPDYSEQSLFKWLLS